MNPYQGVGGQEDQGQGGYGGQQGGSSRPYVNPNEEGVVDPNRYPEPKDSTNKLRGRSEIIETLVGGLEPELVIAKGFYFFFYAAFGSLFPLMGVYFKQLGLNGAQAGLLTGIRPLIEYISTPFWISFGERYRRTKTLLLVSLACWIVFTFPLGSIQPEPTACLVKFNDSTAVIEETKYVTSSGTTGSWTRKKRQAEIAATNIDKSENDFMTAWGKGDFEDSKNKVRSKRAIPKIRPGMSPLKVTYAINYDKERFGDAVSPSFSSLIFKKDDVNKVFMLLLMLVIFGECLSSPAIVIVDSSVLQFLGNDAGNRYGHQRMFGSVGWAISMFFVGIALDHSTFHQRKCAPLPQEKNYTVCFAIFVVLMGLATLLAWRIRVPEEGPDEGGMAGESGRTTMQAPPGQEGFETIDINAKSEYEMTGMGAGQGVGQVQGIAVNGVPQTTVFAQQNKRLPEWMRVLAHLRSPNCIAFLFVAWIMGVGIGLIFTFLFWHLQDYGGSPTLFGIASVINHISEVFAYFFSSQFIVQLGHVKVLCIGLGCNVLRFLYISLLKNPWWVLPFEFVQGITHAAVWAACSSYLSHQTPPEMRPAAQSILQGLHHGLGRGFGAIVGGLFVASQGTLVTYRIYALVCAITLAIFIFINFYHKGDGGFGLSGLGIGGGGAESGSGGGGHMSWNLPPEQDPHVVSEDSSYLAPHGVPGGSSIPRVASNSKLQQQQPQMGQQQQYGQQQQPQQQQYGDPSQQQQQQPPQKNPNNPFNF